MMAIIGYTLLSFVGVAVFFSVLLLVICIAVSKSVQGSHDDYIDREDKML